MFSVYFEYPAYFLIFAVIFSLGVTFLLYFKNKKNKEIKKTTIFILATLRFLFTFIIVSLLLKPIIKTISIIEEKPIIVFAQDNSKSIVLNKDSIFYRTDYQENIKAIRKSLSEKYDFRFEIFPMTLGNDSIIDFSGKETNISEELSLISKKYSGQNLACLILASDGIYNKGNNPVYNSSISCPIYSIALGDTVSQKDILIKEIIHNKTVFLGNTFPINVVIAAEKTNEKETELTITNGKDIVYSSKITLPQNSENKNINIELKANKLGLQQYTIKLASLSDEISYENNISKFVINVIDSRKKILLLAEAPHPDIGAINSALKENPNIEMEIQYADSFSASSNDFDLIILHQLPSNKHNINNIFSELEKNNTAILYFIGNSTSLSNFNNAKQGLEITKLSNNYEFATASYNSDFSTFSLDIPSDFYENLSPLNVCFGNYSLDANAKLLLFQKNQNIKTDKAMIAFLEQENKKIGFIIGDGIWKWRIDDYKNNNEHKNFNLLINKIIQYLIVGQVKDKLSLDYKQIFSETEAINISAEFYNENYEASENLELTLNLFDENKKEYQYNFETSQNKYKCHIDKLKEGNYNFVVSTKYDGKTYTKTGNFVVQKTNIENLITTANHTILQQLAQKTNGKVFSPKEIQTLCSELLETEDIKSISSLKNELKGISDLYILFFVILLFATIEWALRKYFGV